MRHHFDSHCPQHLVPPWCHCLPLVVKPTSFTILPLFLSDLWDTLQQSNLAMAIILCFHPGHIPGVTGRDRVQAQARTTWVSPGGCPANLGGSAGTRNSGLELEPKNWGAPTKMRNQPPKGLSKKYLDLPWMRMRLEPIENMA